MGFGIPFTTPDARTRRRQVRRSRHLRELLTALQSIDAAQRWFWGLIDRSKQDVGDEYVGESAVQRRDLLEAFRHQGGATLADFEAFATDKLIRRRPQRRRKRHLTLIHSPVTLGVSERGSRRIRYETTDTGDNAA